MLAAGESWKGVGPLPAPPAVEGLAAAKDGKAVKLTWKLPFEDWVGCDVERYRI